MDRFGHDRFLALSLPLLGASVPDQFTVLVDFPYPMEGNFTNCAIGANVLKKK